VNAMITPSMTRGRASEESWQGALGQAGNAARTVPAERDRLLAARRGQGDPAGGHASCAPDQPGRGQGRSGVCDGPRGRRRHSTGAGRHKRHSAAAERKRKFFAFPAYTGFLRKCGGCVRCLGFRYLPCVDGNDTHAAPMGGHHHSQGLILAHAKFRLQNHHDELACIRFAPSLRS
jgi:hypothetical protein